MPKREFSFDALAPRLPADLVGRVRGLSPGELKVKRTSVKVTPELTEGERAAIVYASTYHVDRWGEILDPDGAVLKEFEQNPVVLLNHNYSALPVAKAVQVWSDGTGIKAKETYPETDLSEKVWQLVKQGYMNARSVGYIPLEWVIEGEDGWKETVKELKDRWGVTAAHFKDAWVITTKWVLLEYSVVTVPMNPNALLEEAAKNLNLSPGDLMGKTLAELQEMGITLSLGTGLGIPGRADEGETPPEAAGDCPNLPGQVRAINPKRVVPVTLSERIPPRLDMAASIAESVREELARQLGKP